MAMLPPGFSRGDEFIKHYEELERKTAEAYKIEKEELKRNIYSMDLLEVLQHRGSQVQRVPGGWLIDKVFVPMHNEFKPVEKIVDEILKD